MQAVKVLIVEDEMIIADNLVTSIEKFGYEALEPEVTFSGALKAIEANVPDIGIFDINLSGRKSGIDLAKVVQEKYKFPFIFLTSNSDKLTLDEAKLTDPSAFLVKPYSNDELFATIELVLYTYLKRKDKHIESLNNLLSKALFVKQKEIFVRINFSDILYIKSDNVYLDITVKSGKKYTVRSTINNYILKLNSDFLRIHRGCIVNLDVIDGVDALYVYVGKKKLSIGNKFKEDLMSKINKG